MIDYATLPRCRSQQLLAYFGEENPPECGSCDFCLDKKNSAQATPEIDHVELYQVLAARLREQPTLLPAEVYRLFDKLPRVAVEQALAHWLSEGLLKREGLQIMLP